MLVKDRWTHLRAFTSARVALGHAGNALPTSEVLRFRLQHAQARDAVHVAMDSASVAREVRGLRLGFEPVLMRSAAADRAEYLRRPDLGRHLAKGVSLTPGLFDVVFVIADGLSALAIHRHAAAMLKAMAPHLDDFWRCGPVAIVEQSRVAIGDEIGFGLGARMVVVLIGERPGLSSPDSLGVYLTWDPRVGRTDAERNCISNIRDGGLSYAAAAHKLLFLMSESRRRTLSGVNLKEAAGQALSS